MKIIKSASDCLNSLDYGDSMNEEFFAELCRACKCILVDPTMQRLLLYERDDDTMFSCFSQ